MLVFPCIFSSLFSLLCAFLSPVSSCLWPGNQFQRTILSQCLKCIRRRGTRREQACLRSYDWAYKGISAAEVLLTVILKRKGEIHALNNQMVQLCHTSDVNWQCFKITVLKEFCEMPFISAPLFFYVFLIPSICSNITQGEVGRKITERRTEACFHC